ncbi:MAG TPA: chemotaxis protein CheB [Candidatus Eisenbacteria bacterium]|jgi:two-component system CheB/CheR fusion protein
MSPLVVGLGASAGGLEAFEQFFRSVPSDCGMAFVLVQHLDPAHASILTEILQRSTVMRVVEAQDQMVVAPNSVYVIPPNRDMAIFHGALQLSVPEQPRGHRMPIDSFLRSLAEDQGERAMGVILSGTGTDGTLGLRAILGAGGLSFVQEPTTAKYDGMPSSAIQAGFATHVLPVEKMPEAMLAGARTLGIRPEARPAADPGLRHILMLLRSITGHDFSLYKKSTIGRRIERRMSQHDISDMDQYARYIGEHPAEAHTLFTELLINVTSFFRDPEAFSALEKEVLPELFAGKPAGYTFRVWVAGCATGEEAYSIAMVLCEHVEASGQDYRFQIYGTDIDEHAISVARAARYPPNIVQDIEPGRLRRFFVKDENGYRVKKEIRETVVFAVQSVIKDPPFSKLDLLSCRNLMIYLKPELQDRLISTFHFALKPAGVLFLSTSENIGSHPQLFTPLNRKWKLYRTTRSAASTRHTFTDLVTVAAPGNERGAEATASKGGEVGLTALTHQLLLQFYAPACLLTDLRGNILHVHGETGMYLRPAPGKPSLNVIDMAHGALQLELRTAIHVATSRGTPTLDRVVPAGTDSGLEGVRFDVRPLLHPDTGEGLLFLSFHPVPGTARAQPTGGPAAGSVELQRITDLERELAHTRETLHATIEEQETSNEELKSTNEEMQSTNEELQSTNEELETSKEELQSINEELVTVNGELQTKIEQLADMQNDMKNLLDSINIGTIFLDDHLVIRRFTRDAGRIYHVVASDVGRPLSDIKSHLADDDLLAAAQTVLETLIPNEREVRTAGGDWYLARIQPYRTLDNVIEGVVLTFVDISEMKRAREELQEARELAEGIVDSAWEPLLVLDGGLQVVSASRAYFQHFRVGPEETLGRPVYELSNHRWDIPALRELLETVLPRDRSFEGYLVEQDAPPIGRDKMQLSARRVVSKTGNTQLILLAMGIPGQGGGGRESATAGAETQPHPLASEGGDEARRHPAIARSGFLHRGAPARAPGAPDRARNPERGAAARPARTRRIPRSLCGSLRIRARGLLHAHRQGADLRGQSDRGESPG